MNVFSKPIWNVGVLNEAKYSSFLRMHGECADQFDSLMLQIVKFIESYHRSTPLRVRAIFLKTFLYHSGIITRGENRDIKMYYSSADFPKAKQVSDFFEQLLLSRKITNTNYTTIDRLVHDGVMSEDLYDILNDVAKTEADDEIVFPKAIIEESGNIHRLVESLIRAGRFNCSHLDSLVAFTTDFLPSFTTVNPRHSLSEQELKQLQSQSATSGRFVFDPNFGKKSAIAVETLELTEANKQSLLKNPNFVYYFFTAFYVPVMQEVCVGDKVLSEELGNIVLASDNLDKFDEKFRSQNFKIHDTLELSESDRNPLFLNIGNISKELQRQRNIEDFSTSEEDEEYAGMVIPIIEKKQKRLADLFLQIKQFKDHTASFMFSGMSTDVGQSKPVRKYTRPIDQQFSTGLHIPDHYPPEKTEQTISAKKAEIADIAPLRSGLKLPDEESPKLSGLILPD